jgi:spore coat polysaccharide biosynthesis predicted glycosyltransferase SpsG
MNQVNLISDPVFDSGLGHLSRLIAVAQELKLCGIRYCFHPYNYFSPTHTEFIISNQLNPSCTCSEESGLSIVDSYNPELVAKKKSSKIKNFVQFVDEITPIGVCDAIIEVSPISPIRRYPSEVPVLKFKNAPLLRDEVYIARNSKFVQTRDEGGWVLLLGGVSDFKYLEVLSILRTVGVDFCRKLTIATKSEKVVSTAKNLGFTKFCSEQNISYISQHFKYVISAAGVSAWEFSFIGMPGFVISVVDNQEFQLKYLVDSGIRQGVSMSSTHKESEFIEKIDSVGKICNNLPLSSGRVECISFLRQLSLLV